MNMNRPPHLDTPQLKAAWDAVNAWLRDPATEALRFPINARVWCVLIKAAEGAISCELLKVDDLAGHLAVMVGAQAANELREHSAQNRLSFVFNDLATGRVKLVHLMLEPAAIAASGAEA